MTPAVASTSSSARTLGRFSSLAIYKSWILQLIDALDCLHSVGIVHRDLRADNLLFSAAGKHLDVCDLESRWGERSAPEFASHEGLHDSGYWTDKEEESGSEKRHHWRACTTSAMA